MRIFKALAREEVDSSNIATVGYDTDSEILEVEFHNGGVYDYFDVPETVFNQFLEASSKGKFFHRNIKGEYKWEKVRG
jgi:uncharacterized protein YuzE